MKYWLLKSEPGDYSWQQMQADVITSWDGVRNYQARNYMKQMRIGDLCFFYHSVKERSIQGIVEVVQEYYPDLENPKFGLVDIKFQKSLPKSITLHELKQVPELHSLRLIKQSRLSVMPIDAAHWHIIMGL